MSQGSKQSEKEAGAKKDKKETSKSTTFETLGSKRPNLSPAASKEWDRLGCLCPEHLGEVVSFFCDDCSKSGCTVCIMRDHHGHNEKYIGIEGAEEGHFGHTGIFFPSKFTIEGLLKYLNEDLQHIDLKAPDAKERIKACIGTYKGVLETEKRELIDHVNAVKKAKLKYLQEQQKHLRKTLEELNASLSYAKKYVDSDDSLGIVVAEKEITRRLAELDEKCLKISLPTEKDWNLDKIKVIRDGKYVKVNRSKMPPPPPKPGMKTVHDPSFKPAAAKLSCSMDPDMFQAFVKTCCQELGEKYWLRTKR